MTQTDEARERLVQKAANVTKWTLTTDRSPSAAWERPAKSAPSCWP
jgi:hypothetical protein